MYVWMLKSTLNRDLNTVLCNLIRNVPSQSLAGFHAAKIEFDKHFNFISLMATNLDFNESMNVSR